MNPLDPLRSLAATWKLTKAAPLVVLVGGIVLLLFGNASGGVQFVLPSERNLSPDDFVEKIKDRIGLVSTVLLIGVIVSWLLSAWISIGHARAIEKALRTGEDDLGMVFTTGGRFFEMLATLLLNGLIQVVAAVPLFLAWLALIVFAKDGSMESGAAILIGMAAGVVWLAVLLYIYLGLMMAVPIAALEPVGPLEAIKRSFALANGRRWMLLLFALVSTLLSVLGLLACCIGVLFTGSLAQAMKIEAYLLLTRPEYSGWWISTGNKPAARDGGWGSSGA